MAVREYRLMTGPVDYLLFVDRKVVGVIEAEKDGETLSGYEIQAQRYTARLPAHLQAPLNIFRFFTRTPVTKFIYEQA